MCDCRSLPSSWRANDDSDYQAESVHGWHRSSQIAYGWAMLWKCPACGQFWEGLVTPSGYKGSTDYVCKYYGAEHDWFVKHEQTITVLCVKGGSTKRWNKSPKTMSGKVIKSSIQQCIRLGTKRLNGDIHSSVKSGDCLAAASVGLILDSQAAAMFLSRRRNCREAEVNIKYIFRIFRDA